MNRQEQVCAYLEAMAEKVGGDVKVYTNAEGKYMMQKRGDLSRSVRVSLDERREEFDRKVRWLMEG